MEGFKAVPYIFLVVAVAAIIGGAGVITLSEFGDTVDTCFNSSYTLFTNMQTGDRCNSTAGNVGDSGLARNMSREYFVIWNGMDASDTVGEQLSTLAVIGIMVVIIGLLAGVFVYFKYFR